MGWRRTASTPFIAPATARSGQGRSAAARAGSRTARSRPTPRRTVLPRTPSRRSSRQRDGTMWFGDAERRQHAVARRLAPLRDGRRAAVERRQRRSSRIPPASSGSGTAAGLALVPRRSTYERWRRAAGAARLDSRDRRGPGTAGCGSRRAIASCASTARRCLHAARWARPTCANTASPTACWRSKA